MNEAICASSRQKKSLHIRRGQAICNLVLSNANEGTSYYIPRPEDDWDALSSLADDDILHYDNTMGGFFVTHDVYEEIVFLHILSQAYLHKQNVDTLFQAIGDSLVMRKAFRLWLHHQFEDTSNEIVSFLSDTLTQENLNAIWKDEILIALMGEDNVKYLLFLDNILKEHDYQLFTRALILLNTACKTVDIQFWQRILTEEEIEHHNIYRCTKPSGSGWSYLISYAYTHRADIPWSPVVIMLTADMLYTWANHIHNGKTTRNAGLMSLYLYRLIRESNEYHYQIKSESLEHCFFRHRVKYVFLAIENSHAVIFPLSSYFLTAGS